MARISSKPEDASVPIIDRESVAGFFKGRAKKVDQIGHVQAVIYQDKNPDLARQRDVAEKAKLLPLLNLRGIESVLDVGCGTGRWADVIVPRCGSYKGADFSQEFVDISSRRFGASSNVSFVRIAAEEISPATIGETFQVILSLGLFIYLNDDELVRAIRGYGSVADESCRILIREPVGIASRLTIKDHFSDELGQVYNAIYRTEDELMKVVLEELFPIGFRLKESGDVYEAALNNRLDTKQMWFLLEK
ncbi:MAG: class I SAM-dependent methyltransferase [Rhodocyclaceae bacterium]|jgi:SAM-dependent methyltransferase|nr:class I SAM-dependent methyltransferase [Rhodocyclaceae bacterium]